MNPPPVGHCVRVTTTIARLSAEDVELLGKELDTIRQDVLDSRGERDAAYIRRLVKAQRLIELGSRAVLLRSAHRGA